MLELDRIYQADAFDMFPRIDDGSIDLVICDGPYGITTNEWDRIDNIQEYNLELIRIFSEKLKEGGGFYLFGKPNCIDPIVAEIGRSVITPIKPEAGSEKVRHSRESGIQGLS